MNILLLKGFNNYFNRIVKFYSTLDDYKANASSYIEISSINFNPSDGVRTELILGKGQIGTFFDFDQTQSPDYLVCYKVNDDNSIEIEHRWFIIETDRTRGGQYKTSLKRDVLAEHFDEIVSSPCFVEKGFVSNTDSTLLYNNEQMTYNQIKRSEELLKDETGCGWIVGYTSQDENRYPTSDYYKSTSPVAIYEDYADLPTLVKNLIGKSVYCVWDNANTKSGLRYSARFTNTAIIDNTTIRQIVRERKNGSIRLDQSTPASGQVAINPSNAFEYSGTYPNAPLAAYGAWTMNSKTLIAYLMNKIKDSDAAREVFYNKVIDNISVSGDQLKMYLDATDREAIAGVVGRYIKKDNKIYKIKLDTTQYRQVGDSWCSVEPGTTAEDTAISDIWSFINDGIADTEVTSLLTWISGNTISSSTYNSVAKWKHSYLQQRSSWQFDIGFNITNLSIVLEEVSDSDASIVKAYMPATRQQCYDAPMDIFAIPYADEFEIIHHSYGTITMSKETALQAACALAQAGDNVYDLQILPYFPTREYVGSSASDDDRIFNKAITITANSDLTEDVQYNMIKNNSLGNIGIIFWSRNSAFTFDINKAISIGSDPLQSKISNETDMYRLVSPNYSGQFEFSVAKAGGSVEAFNVDCTYKPYNPYIHVAPYLRGLYGEFAELDDARGLICGGDFSLTRITSAWENYQLNNKNYQEIFDRQIKNLDVNNAIAMERAQFEGGIGIATGGLTGAAAGAMVGGGWGAVAGGAAGLIGSGVGYAKDIDWLERSQSEARHYQKDMYGYRLGNIQAMPNSLAKTTAMTNNNRIFPFVELYSATEEEVELLTNKIKYDGMTVMAVGTIGNFSSSPFDKTFVKGQLIRAEGINDDFHVVDTVFQEVQKGFYIPQGE